MDSILDVCPELEDHCGLTIYVDAGNDEWVKDEKPTHRLRQVVQSQQLFNNIVISGSTGVSAENASALSSILQHELGYERKRIGLLLPNHKVLSNNFGFVIIPSVLNSKNPYYHHEIAQNVAPALPELRFSGVVPISLEYLLVEPAEHTTVGRVVDPDIIGREDFEKARYYSDLANQLGFRTMYLEAGSGAPQTVPAGIVRAVRERFNGILTVGGGLKTADDVYGKLAAGATLVTVGDILEKTSDVPGRLQFLHQGVERANAERRK